MRCCRRSWRKRWRPAPHLVKPACTGRRSRYRRTPWTHDWASFLGPSHNAVSTETKLSRTLPPPLVWELAKGSGYASPAIAGDHLVFLHRLANEEIVECLHPEAGSCHWQFRYATAFEDRYGYNNGPRSSPVINVEGKRVYTMGAEGKLHCLALRSGTVVWKRDLRARVRSTSGFLWDRIGRRCSRVGC